MSCVSLCCDLDNKLINQTKEVSPADDVIDLTAYNLARTFCDDIMCRAPMLDPLSPRRS